jgi:hypothetical protein
LYYTDCGEDAVACERNKHKAFTDLINKLRMILNTIRYNFFKEPVYCTIDENSVLCIIEVMPNPDIFEMFGIVDRYYHLEMFHNGGYINRSDSLTDRVEYSENRYNYEDFHEVDFIKFTDELFK